MPSGGAGSGAFGGGDAVSQEKCSGDVEVIGCDPDGGINIAFVDVQREKPPTLGGFGVIDFLEFGAGAPGADFEANALGETPEEVTGQMVGRGFGVNGDQAEIAAEIGGGLHEVAREPACEAVLAQEFGFAGKNSGWNIGMGCVHKLSVSRLFRTTMARCARRRVLSNATSHRSFAIRARFRGEETNRDLRREGQSVQDERVSDSAQQSYVPGQKVTVEINDIAFGGEGVGRIDDFVVFVPFVAPGERLEVELTEVKKRFARGKVVQIAQPSAQRVKPPCRYFGECGGCQYQHLAYALQLEIKRKQIADLFERVGHLKGDLVQPVAPCPSPYGYRNRIMIRSQWDKFKQGLNIGYIRADNRLVVDIEECVIAEPALNAQIQEVRRHPPPKGGLKVTLRVAPEGWVLPRDSFFQNNFFLLPKLVETVRERLRESGSVRLLDAYCGVGFFALELGDLVEEFVGIEIDAAAIKAAKQNAANRSRKNGRFIEGSTEELLPETLAQMGAEATSVILDPPRKGCDPGTLELLRRLRPRQVIYVSCHPATLARDLNALCAGGVFEVMTIVPLDMFPQTQHVECVADLRRATHSLPK